MRQALSPASVRGTSPGSIPSHFSDRLSKLVCIDADAHGHTATGANDFGVDLKLSDPVMGTLAAFRARDRDGRIAKQIRHYILLNSAPAGGID